MACGLCSRRRCEWCLGVCGGVVLVLMLASLPLLGILIQQQVKQLDRPLIFMSSLQRVVLEEGSLMYPIWKNPSASLPIYMQFYLFDLTNPSEVLQGSKPFVQQRGPYTYKEHREKYDIIHNPNGTVTYRERIWYEFQRNMSAGAETDTITTFNMVLLGLVNAIKFESGDIQRAVSLLLSLFASESVLLRLSVGELVWGYQDKLLKMAGLIFPAWFYTSQVGVLAGKNNTDNGLFTIHTGAKDVSKVGLVDQFNGTQFLPYWSTPYANMINGTDGTMIHPSVGKDDRLYVFSPDICRSVYGTYNNSLTWSNGVPYYRFTAAKAVLESREENPDNLGFCTPQYKCMGSGVLNISQCKVVDYFHIPLVLSLPHFMQAEDRYCQAIHNLHPDPTQHTTVTDVEPISGILLHVAKKLQIGIYIQPNKHIKNMQNLREMVYPILWVNESATIDEKHAEMIKWQLLIPLKIAHITQYVLIAVSLVMIAAAVTSAFFRHRKQVLVKQGDASSVGSSHVQDDLEEPTERSPLLFNNHN